MLRPNPSSRWTQDGVPGPTSSIAPEIWEKIGAWIRGCDICQEVCPRNRRRLKAALPPDPFLEEIAGDFDLIKLLGMSEEFYSRRVQPLMHNYIRDRKYFRINAWALARIGGPRSRQILAASLAAETAESVVGEIKTALIIA